jgi:TetR/AcrR family transcriptional regulator, transcriptional repressor for nem operon
MSTEKVSEKVTKGRLLEVALTLFQTKGCHNTSMDDIAKACQIKKPSIYHHIESRSALLCGVVDLLSTQFSEKVLVFARDETQSIKIRIENVIEAVLQFFNRGHYSCLISQLASESSEKAPDLHKRLRGFFTQWVDALKYLLQDRLGNAASAYAQDYISQIQGALTLSVVAGDEAIFERAVNRLSNLLKI